MYTEAALYDLIYTATDMDKDYAGEARKIADLLRHNRPQSRTLLDVACGTGEHARYLSEVHGFAVDGIDLSPEMIARARAKCPLGRFTLGDMTNFHLGRCFDGVICMFGAIAHSVTMPRLRETLACLRDHLAPGGIAVVQPYRTPGAVQPGVREYTVAAGDLQITRTRRSELDGQRYLVHYHYTVEGPDGTREADEIDEWGLFTVDEMLAAFTAVGLAVTYDASWADPAGIGIYLASVPA